MGTNILILSAEIFGVSVSRGHSMAIIKERHVSERLREEHAVGMHSATLHDVSLIEERLHDVSQSAERHSKSEKVF